MSEEIFSFSGEYVVEQLESLHDSVMADDILFLMCWLFSLLLMGLSTRTWWRGLVLRFR